MNADARILAWEKLTRFTTGQSSPELRLTADPADNTPESLPKQAKIALTDHRLAITKTLSGRPAANGRLT
jgi:hypothetical protein